ncbi:YVTN family beta-propeller repeat protein [Occallatibacter riparius]|uniref:Beta-propeller fold lactonase family protein n=1 Tax=Occallatibacter riparius TaxID=1002689 RepID=A0A9J7BJP1_9BACT|nr:beta-propeller fold lactonase family protein [Occallatibacter riparius]UWZ82755.1 beta-propeller fold lactonase family protein [Occallatibacter riparius]
MTEESKQIPTIEEGGRSGRLFRVSLFSCLLFVACFFTACRRHDFPQYPANYREYAYVTNGESGTVSIYDVVNVRLDREVQVGQRPVAVAVSPSRNEVYVVNQGAATGQGAVTVLNAEKNSIAATIPLHKESQSIDIDAEHDLAYVANWGSNSVSVVDLKNRREIAQIGTGEHPATARVAPDGKTIVVPNRTGNSVSIIDAGSRRVRAIFEGCPGASDAVILPDSSKAFVACSSGHQLMAITLANSKFNVGGADQLEAMMDVGRAPVHLALKPDGGELFVSNEQSDSISEVVTTTNDVGGASLIGDDPVRGIVSSDNSLLYVAAARSSEVTMYSIDDGKRAASIHIGDGPSAMAFSTAGHLLFVVDSRSGDVAVVRTSTRSLFTMLPAGRGPNAIAVKAFTVK